MNTKHLGGGFMYSFFKTFKRFRFSFKSYYRIYPFWIMRGQWTKHDEGAISKLRRASLCSGLHEIVSLFVSLSMFSLFSLLLPFSYLVSNFFCFISCISPDCLYDSPGSLGNILDLYEVGKRDPTLSGIILDLLFVIVVVGSSIII